MCFSLATMMASRVSILLVLVAGAVGGCVADGRIGIDVDPDPGSATAVDRRPSPNPGPSPGPGDMCSLVGGPATAAAILGAVDYEVTGGPTGSGNGTSLQISEIGWMTRHTAERGTEDGLLDGLTLYGLDLKVINAQLPSLCSTYSCAGCAGDYVHKLTVYLDDAPYTVQVDFRASPPERLVALINAVQDITVRPLP